MSGSTWLIRYQGADKMFNAVRIFWLKTYFRQHFELEKLLELEKVEFWKSSGKKWFFGAQFTTLVVRIALHSKPTPII